MIRCRFATPINGWVNFTDLGFTVGGSYEIVFTIDTSSTQVTTLQIPGPIIVQVRDGIALSGGVDQMGLHPVFTGKQLVSEEKFSVISLA